MIYKRNGLGWCEAAEVKNFVKLIWRHKAVSMVLFSKRNNGVYGAYRGVIDFSNCCGGVDHAADNWV